MSICLHVIYELNILSCLIRSVFVNMSFGCPVFLTICPLWYCSVITGILLMYLVLHVITLPDFISLPLYNSLLWSALLLLTITPCIHGPISSLGDGGKSPKMFLEPVPKFSPRFSNIFLRTVYVRAFEFVDYPTLLKFVVPVLECHEECFYSVCAFEMYLYSLVVACPFKPLP